MSAATEELRDQWANPGDILSILMLIGGGIIQKAVAQMVGYQVSLPWNRKHGLSIAPIAFSFGWAAYAFSNLLSAVGDMRLMPASDCPSILINCSNGFVRETRSFVLGRILRDHENRHVVDPRPEEEGGRAESIRIDVFNLEPVFGPAPDIAWFIGWAVLLLQFIIASLPWILYGNWAIMLVTICGNVLVAITCAIPQWTDEKWAGAKLTREKVTCLTRGNGQLHIMVVIAHPGAWDLETLATGSMAPRPETRWICLILAVLWACLLINISGMKHNTWFLIGIGALGMLQNVFAAGVPRKPGASNFHLTKFSRAPTIIGKRKPYKDDPSVSVDLEQELEKFADLQAWAVSPPISKCRLPHQRVPSFPRWLNSMSREDGIPEWLEPLSSARRAASEPLPASTQPKMSPWTENGSSDVIYAAAGVHGALMELEKWVPTAGLAMLQILFPSGLKYRDESVRDNTHKTFWQKAYHTKSVRKMGEEKRRAEERIVRRIVDV